MADIRLRSRLGTITDQVHIVVTQSGYSVMNPRVQRQPGNVGMLQKNNTDTAFWFGFSHPAASLFRSHAVDTDRATLACLGT